MSLVITPTLTDTCDSHILSRMVYSHIEATFTFSIVYTFR